MAKADRRPAEQPPVGLASRQAAFDVLYPFEADAFRAVLPRRHQADELLREHLARQPDLSAQDAGLAAALVDGVLRTAHVLAHWLLALQAAEPPARLTPASPAQLKRLKAFDARERLAIKLGLYQLAYCDHIPDYAALDSTLALMSARKLPDAARKRAHAVLARAQRHLAQTPVWAQLTAPEPALVFSGAVLDALAEGRPGADLAGLAALHLQPKGGLGIRVNTLKTTVADYAARLSAAEIAYAPVGDDVPESLFLPAGHPPPTALPGFSQGEVYIQDAGSARVARWVSPRPGERVLDLCAAPGSKTTHLAALMENRGEILAVDVSQKRLLRLEENLARLGVANVRVQAASALELSLKDGPPFDAVLIDAPCSGSGTFRHQPDALLQCRAVDLAENALRQQALLCHVAENIPLSPCGRLVYSTCSLFAAENQAVIAAFLTRHPGWRLAFESTPQPTATADGFYGAVLTPPGAPD